MDINKKYKDTKVIIYPKDRNIKIIFVILFIFIVIIIILVAILFMTFAKIDKIVNSQITNVDSKIINLDVTPPSNAQLEKIKEIQLKRSQKIFELQKNYFEAWYSRLDLNKEQMDRCFLENNYTNEDLNLENAKHLNKIKEDARIAKDFGIIDTPTLFFNSQKIKVYNNYDLIRQSMAFALDEDIVDLNLENNNFIANTRGPPTVTIIYNQKNPISENYVSEYITGLKNGSYSDFFEKVFSEVQIVKLHYTDKKAQEIMEATKVSAIPFLFFDGDIQSTKFYLLSPFRNFFVPVANGYVLPVVSQQELNYKNLKTENDYIIGYDYAQVKMVLFVDLENPKSITFVNNYLNKLKTEYIDPDIANLIIKNISTSETSITPVLFAKCSQDQNKFYDAYELLIYNTDIFLKDVIMESNQKYDLEIQRLNAEFVK